MALVDSQPALADPSLRVLVLPATARDGAVAQQVLRQVGIRAEVVGDPGAVAAALATGLGAILVSERVFGQPSLAGLLDALDHQPAWSDVPVVLTMRGEVSARVERLQRRFTNVTLLDRPTSVRSLVSAIEAALRARRRQYEIRDRIESLERAERALLESDRRKDLFLATLAHELRNPLAPIRNAAHILSLPAQEPDRVAQLAQIIHRQSSAMALLLDDLLDIARINSGKLVLRPAPVALRSVVASAIEAARPLIDGKRHQLRVQVPEPGAMIEADALRLSQVLTNLLTNAAKYTEAGGHIELEALVQGALLRLSVRDDGVGVDPALLPRLFEMFHQEPGTLGQAQGGLGIGLALSRSLVRLHGGRIEGRSEGPGRGAEFVVTLPVVAAAAAEARHELAPPAAAVDNARRQLLVVDDNVDAALSLAMMLRQEGYPVEVRHGGAAGLERAGHLRPAAMLLDIGMPGMDGYALARRVRREPWGAQVLLVAITGWGQPDDRQRAVEAGFDEHLTKPVALADLTDILRRRLPRRPGDGGA